MARTDFEENGVPSDVLQLLQDVSIQDSVTPRSFLCSLHPSLCCRNDMKDPQRRSQSDWCCEVVFDSSNTSAELSRSQSWGGGSLDICMPLILLKSLTWLGSR